MVVSCCLLAPLANASQETRTQQTSRWVCVYSASSKCGNDILKKMDNETEKDAETKRYMESKDMVDDKSKQESFGSSG